MKRRNKQSHIQQRLADGGIVKRRRLDIPSLPCQCGKRGYNDEVVANMVLSQNCWSRLTKGNKRRREVRVYRCEHGKYHTTSWPLEMYEEISNVKNEPRGEVEAVSSPSHDDGAAGASKPQS